MAEETAKTGNAGRQSEFREWSMPKDPQRAGMVGKRRACYGEIPDPNGNRAARRAYKRSQAAIKEWPNG